ncbi:MAG: hypothetical protein HC859_11090 [Bacteroidia bacterium]|nr:hypothetical protein [Bacteroidia bacterium]
MSFRRVICVYDFNDDSMLAEYDISHIPVRELKKILSPDEDDGEMLEDYPIGEDELQALLSLMPDEPRPALALDHVKLFYECFIE